MTMQAGYSKALRARATGLLGGLVLLSACSDIPADHGAPPAAAEIVSLNLCTDAILVEVAAPEQIAALSHFSFNPEVSQIAPEVAARFARTGVTAEEVLALSPDIVLGDIFLSQPIKTVFAELGLRTEIFGIAAEPQASFAQIRKIAQISENPAQGEALIARIEAALVQHSAPSDTRPISTVLWQPGEIVPGEETLINNLLRHTGFSSHSAAQGLRQADHLSLEAMLANPPELLIIAGNSRGQLHPALDQIEGMRVETLDPALLYCGGPTIIPTLERLSAIREQLR